MISLPSLGPRILHAEYPADRECRGQDRGGRYPSAPQYFARAVGRPGVPDASGKRERCKDGSGDGCPEKCPLRPGTLRRFIEVSA